MRFLQSTGYAAKAPLFPSSCGNLLLLKQESQKIEPDGFFVSAFVFGGCQYFSQRSGQYSLAD